MRRRRKRKMHYSAQILHDGTLLAAYPIRKPVPKVIKREGLRIDEDGVTIEYASAGEHLSDCTNDTRMRFQNIVATNLNTRRAIRELVVEPLNELRAELDALRAEVQELRATAATSPA